MAFLKVQKLQYDEHGHITSGSASIVESVYVPTGRYHTKHVVLEQLGKVLWLAPDKKSGIFLSSTRGLVAYSSVSNTFQDVDLDDPRLEGLDVEQKEPKVHRIFGDIYFLLSRMERTGFVQLLKTAFPDRLLRARLLCHLLHDIGKDGSRIACDDFITRSAAVHLFPKVPVESLREDVTLYAALGQESSKECFFQAYSLKLQQLGKGNADVSGIFVDTVPLPSDIESPFHVFFPQDCPEKALRTRLSFFVEQNSGLPIWFDLLPSEALSESSLKQYGKSLLLRLGIPVSAYRIGPRGLTKDLLHQLLRSTHWDCIAQMPDRSGFPYRLLFDDSQQDFEDPAYAFVWNSRPYFGKAVPIHSGSYYIYVDKSQARASLQDYLILEGGEYEDLPEVEQKWLKYRGGYFVLVSSQKDTPEHILDQYRRDSAAERAIKVCTDWDELPQSSWTKEMVLGKVLYESIRSIAVSILENSLPAGAPSLSEILGAASSVMCIPNDSGTLLIDLPNTAAKEALAAADTVLPSSLDPDAFAWRF